MSVPAPDGFLRRLGHWARTTPDAVAVSEDGLSIGYAEFRELITAAADRLTRAGLRPADRVALVGNNSAAYLVNAFAVWEAGGVLATIYPSLGTAELTYCLDSADPVLVIADERVDEAVRAHAPAGVPVVGLGLRPTVGKVATGRQAPPTELAGELALLCFTSGSTSVPKAVMHSLDGLTAAAATFARVWHITPEDRTIVCLPMAWAFGLVTTSMTTLLSGGTVLPLARTRPEALVCAIAEDKATFLAGVTTVFTKLVEHLAALPRLPDTSSLRLCVSGGEPRNEKSFARWQEMTHVPVHDNYAASECFPVITYDPVSDPVPRYRSSGRVVSGARMRIVDGDGHDVAPGQAGEALWQGPAQMLGYWKNPEQTAKALTADGWYRTSDLVRVDEGGYVYVEGRLSDMIIRGGSNVSPSEVEAVLAAHASVRQIAVVGIDDEIYGQQVVAVVYPQDPDTFDGDALLAYGRTRLAGYKVPTRVVCVGEELPLHPATDKVDRKRLAGRLTTASGSTP
ncbi:class I adenylate-forming enzyme family protein [Streptomyces sp. GMR22]|uniref:class I adenylate-forming enzyme family protein n=1 Tax=Streptomyces sp. GMR22 TaxID=2759524 RepID=UPI0015FCF5D2|nr:class I adenylate-forming enzyme family protein [Streptomyces sp. GMR22]MBA6440763.1 acyl--CoA ligase [Streptomyces sp. GMR22]